jgi:hypothetical protein
MTHAIRAHFDGKFIIPDEPVNLPSNQPLTVSVRSPAEAAQCNQRVRYSGDNGQFAGDSGIAEVIELTRRMFPGAATAELRRDPEDPETSFVVITASFSGPPEELADLRVQWHERVSRLSSGQCGNISLSIVPA